jgi:outer membrane protein insertion porin family
VKNRAFTSQRLRQEFPMKAGEWFERDKVAAGLEALRKLYGADGFLDYSAIPDTEFGSNATVSLRLSFDEGPQYHLQKVEILAKKDLAAKLRLQWKLDEGSVYDHDYVDRYIEENRDLLPEGFLGERVQVVRDCPEALVDVRIVVDASEDTSKSVPKDVPCETREKKGNAEGKTGD